MIFSNERYITFKHSSEHIPETYIAKTNKMNNNDSSYFCKEEKKYVIEECNAGNEQLNMTKKRFHDYIIDQQCV